MTLTYATYLLPDGKLGLLIGTGDGSTPTPDGGPWVCEYSAPPFADPSDCAVRAERILAREVKRRAPEVFREAVNLGWWSADT